MDALERHYRDVQDVEFTIEQGRALHPPDAIREADGRRGAAGRDRDGRRGHHHARRRRSSASSPPRSTTCCTRWSIPPSAVEVAATGVPASPGAAVGVVVFDPDVAAERGENEAGHPRPLRHDAGRHPRARRGGGVLTAHGGMASHAAVVARGMGKPCVAGCDALRIDEDAGICTIGAHEVREGDPITIDGSTGRVLDRRGRRSSSPARTPTSRRSSPGPTASARSACARTPTRRTTPRARADSAPRESASAGPSTCSSARSGCPSCRR